MKHLIVRLIGLFFYLWLGNIFVILALGAGVTLANGAGLHIGGF